MGDVRDLPPSICPSSGCRASTDSAVVKRACYDALLEWTQRWAAEQGKDDAIHHELNELNGEVRRAYEGELRPIKPGFSFVLTLVTIGIYGFYVLYRMNRYWWDAQVVEQDFDDKLSQMLMKLGIVRHPINYQIDQKQAT